MRRKSGTLTALIAVATTSGCSGVIHKQFNIDEVPPNSLSIDARQRVVLVTDKGGKKGDKHVVCAEPSPDVFAALAAAASTDVGIGEKKVGVSGSLAEAAQALGPRTQTIQLLRDGLFRACEAYMNGIVDWREYKLIVTRYDEAMMTTLAIDGLTQRYAIPGPLTPGATAGASEGTRSTSAGSIVTEGEGSTSALPTSVGMTAPVVTGQNNANVVQAIKEILSQHYELQLTLQDKIIESSKLQVQITANELRLKEIELEGEEANQ